jgi:alkylhydroperoxidase/carboxymuconolactone decarboxylase family protein YurZ
MAFFDLPPEVDIPPESFRVLDELRRLLGREKFSPTWHAYGRQPRILESRWLDSQNLVQHCRFPNSVKAVGAMLIAHARRCSSCFGASRATLTQLGFDEPALDAMCSNPEALPLDHRGRRFVHWALKFATGTPDLTPKDFREMAEDGFTPEEVQEIVGFAVYWVGNTMFSTAARVGLSDD